MTDTKQDFVYPTVWVAYKPKDEQHTDHHRVKQIVRCEDALDVIERKHHIKQLHGSKAELEPLHEYIEEYGPTEGYYEYSLIERLVDLINLVQDEINDPSRDTVEFVGLLEDVRDEILETYTVVELFYGLRDDDDDVSTPTDDEYILNFLDELYDESEVQSSEVLYDEVLELADAESGEAYA
ncbi:hypothetical protein [Halolamina salifodinae]|uniref:Uncharacterized protein n=1 Tax=Halolamina salifodinae TaxID=1202767 RepID=A0A8T4GVR2_9EURY|nr:hypothetical protein [Halolamina salifodinae]MBP1986989.1 hypothetical protein [Halolamina salifodinae]